MAYTRTLEHEQTLGYWLAERGISKKALDAHPHIDDVILLLKWRDRMWNKLNNSEKAVWGAYWGSVYHKQKALKNKALAKLEKITITVTERHNKIKALRKAHI